mmetsp:Transcript_21780/g.43618  ORF Transcript_21780/g.43618 Transcript_21780/m.43618 type:complete len:368 (-) Transcript_21780:282-1385(-)
MVVQATAPPAEEPTAAAETPKITADPSIVTVAADEEENAAESRDVADTQKSGEVTPSSARGEFIFSPQPPTMKKSRSNASRASVKAEEAPVEAADDKEEAAAVEEPIAEEPVVEEPAVEEPAVEEVAEETPVEETVEETAAPVEEAAPAEEAPSMFTSFLEKATALCGTVESALVENEMSLPAVEAKESLPAVEAKASSEVAPVKTKSEEEPETKPEPSVLMSPIAKAKAAMNCGQGEDATDDISVSMQSTSSKAAGLLKCQKDDLSMVLTDKEEAEVVKEKDTETAPAEEEQKTVEEEKEEEEPKEEEESKEEEPAPEVPAPAVVEAPKKKKMSMKKKMSKKFKGIKKVFKSRASKPKVEVVKALE